MGYWREVRTKYRQTLNEYIAVLTSDIHDDMIEFKNYWDKIKIKPKTMASWLLLITIYIPFLLLLLISKIYFPMLMLAVVYGFLAGFISIHFLSWYYQKQNNLDKVPD